MSDNISISISLPLDSEGFICRECPTCGREFKWFGHESGDPNAEQVDQYFCPLCGVAAGLDSWWTPAQIKYAYSAAAPEIDDVFQDALSEAFKGMKGLSYTPNRDFSLDIERVEPPAEPDDMTIAQPPCHPNEPIKVPDGTDRLHCLVCGTIFAI